MAAFCPKIAPKHDAKICFRLLRLLRLKWADFFEGGAMPRMPKKRKLEMFFFLNERGRVTYNDLCRKCQRTCRQSFRAVIVDCPHYLSKRSKRKVKEDTD